MTANRIGGTAAGLAALEPCGAGIRGQEPEEGSGSSFPEALKDRIKKEKEDREVPDGMAQEELTAQEALLEYYEFVRKRIKEGPPSYQIGASSLTVKEWQRMMEQIDEEIEDIRENRVRDKRGRQKKRKRRSCLTNPPFYRKI